MLDPRFLYQFFKQKGNGRVTPRLIVAIYCLIDSTRFIDLLAEKEAPGEPPEFDLRERCAENEQVLIVCPTLNLN